MLKYNKAGKSPDEKTKHQHSIDIILFTFTPVMNNMKHKTGKEGILFSTIQKEMHFVNLE